MKLEVGMYCRYKDFRGKVKINKIKKIQETECLSASSVKRSLPEKKQRNRFRSYLRKLFKRGS